MWCAIRSNTNEFEIFPGLQVVKGRGLERAAATTCYIQGDSSKEMVVAGGNNGCLRVYSVSFRISAQANLSTEVVITKSGFLVESEGSKAHACRINISSGDTQIASARADGSTTVILSTT